MCQAFEQWPDTGQTTSYTDAFGEDSDYSKNPKSYTKLAYGGVELSEATTSSNGWIMVKDNVTGLVWEVKTVDGSIRIATIGGDFKRSIHFFCREYTLNV